MKKQSFITILFSVLMSTISTESFAKYEAQIDGIYYRFSDTEAIVTYYNDLGSKNQNAYYGDVIIPESVTYRDKIYSVTNIDGSAFIGCIMLKSVVIGDNVTKIGKGAFGGCTGLASITIGNSVTSIGSSAFSRCIGLTSIVIPNSVTEIGDGAFALCSGLTSINIPNSVIFIGWNAFMGCSGLTSIAIPNNITTIDGGTFSGCSGLTTITIPNSVTSIGYGAFENCTSLTSIDIPNSVTSIGGSAFENCSSLCSIIIPNSVTSVGSDAFSNTAWFNNQPSGLLYVGKVAYEYKDFVPKDTHITIKDGTTEIAGEAFCYELGLTSITIPNSVTSIGSSAFNGSSLSSVTIPNSVTSIGNNAFQDCWSLTSVTIPNSVTSIGSEAFYRCKALTSVIIPTGVTDVEASIFDGCSALESVTIPNSVKYIRPRAFANCSSLIDVFCYAEKCPYVEYMPFEATPIKNSTLHVPTNAIEAYRTTSPWSEFKEIVALDSAPIDDSTISGKCGDDVNYAYEKEPHTLTISGNGEMADYYHGENESPWSSYADVIQSVEIETGITSIGNFAFYKCSNIMSLSIPSTVGYIGSSAFENCTSLTSLPLCEGLLSIGGSAFEGCTGLQTITIPSTVNTISINAFKNCKGITDVYCYAKDVPDTHFDAYDGTPTEKSTLHVPASAIEKYRAAWPWSDFKEIVTIEEEAPDGIISVKHTDDCNGDYYDLTGRRILLPQKGLYIRNGKKIVVK